MPRTMSINGLSQPVSNISVDGFAPLFLSSGIAPASVGARFFATQVTSTVTGTWTIDISVAAFPTVAYAVGAMAVSSGDGNQAMYTVTVQSQTATTISGTVLTPTSAIVGNLPLVRANKAVTFNLLVCGW